MKKITKKYLLAFAFVFFLLPILKVSADDTSSTDTSPTIAQATTTFNLNYSTDGNGIINGSSTQVVNQGQDGIPVTAEANPGFQFVNWSDNSTSSVRTDTNVQDNHTFTAFFASTTNSTGSSSNPTSTTTSTSTATSTSASSSPIEVHVNVPTTCEVTDTNNNTYDFPATDSPAGYLGICALESAKESDVISDFQLSYYSGFGLFVSSINGVSANPLNQYWALYLNDNFAGCGLGCLPIMSGDKIEFQLHDFSDNDLGNHITIDVDTLLSSTTTTSTTTPISGGGGGGSPISHKTPNLENMLSFLDANQNAIFSSDYYIDWGAIAYGSEPNHASNVKNQIINSLKNNLLNGIAITDYERHSMAMMALGLNPYTDGKENYIQKIADAWNIEPSSYISPYTDDVFGIITLISAGYSTSDQIIQKMESSIIAKQTLNGELEGSIDLTGAAIQSLELVQNLSGASDAITKGINFLKSSQLNDGGFYNPDSTSWAIQGLVAGNLDPKQVVNIGNNPFDYLASNQLADGSIGTTTDPLDTRVWATEWAIPATVQKTWPEILQSVSKPAESSGGVLSSTSASTTITIATTTSTSTVVDVQTVLGVVNASSTLTIPPRTIATIKTNTTSTTTPKLNNSNLLANAQSSGFTFDTHSTFMILGSILAGIGLFSMIFI